MARRSPVKVVGSRLVQALPVILLATFMVFALLKLVPGDIAVTLAGDNATDARITEIRKIYGLDRPFLVQYGAWLGNVAQGDLSQSLLTGEKVADSIGRAFPNTLLVVVIALALALVTGIPMGVMAAIKPNGWIDKLISMLASLGVAVPGFWLAMILVAEFSLKLNWLPATGAKSFSASPVDAIRHALLPGIAIAAYGMAEVARQLRGALLEVLSSQYVRTLHAKGLSMSRILWQHGLKNVGVNLLTIISLLVNRMLAATVVIEAVFAIPGLGSLIVRGAIQRDFPIVQGVVFTMVVVVIAVNLITDLLCAAVDPRIEQ
ncbi:ABC transporter permease [Bradyrhizobium sp. BRP56]|uniref:ABC transporter permease n=1 Tax=Bradyrhizobium sp. BRP56 TaxID=2793819 RepID=UPI001CD44152|nr:ABC transporter permease [Bradyrhizobium sp. BRP56]MCA1400892.1 ABC transporter permease [Bradyrhizobium sp. BRP56]